MCACMHVRLGKANAEGGKRMRKARDALAFGLLGKPADEILGDSGPLGLEEDGVPSSRTTSIDSLKVMVW